MSVDPWKSPYVVTVKPPEGFTAKPGIVGFGTTMVTVYQTQYAERGPWAECFRATACYVQGRYDLTQVDRFVRKRTRWHRVFSENRPDHVAGGNDHTGFLQARTVEVLAREVANAWEASQRRGHAIDAAIRDATGEKPLATWDLGSEVVAVMSDGPRTFQIAPSAPVQQTPPPDPPTVAGCS